jgi:hypothetical protein
MRRQIDPLKACRLFNIDHFNPAAASAEQCGDCYARGQAPDQRPTARGGGGLIRAKDVDAVGMKVGKAETEVQICQRTYMFL